MGLQTLELRIEQSVATITLNRPKALNAINLAMVGELEQVVRQLRDAPIVRVVVITSAGDKALAAGVDVTEFKVMSPIDAWMFVQCLRGEHTIEPRSALRSEGYKIKTSSPPYLGERMKVRGVVRGEKI